MIVHQHIAYYEEIFPIPGFLADPILVFGFQEVGPPPPGRPSASEFFNYPDLNAWLRAHGHRDITTLDHFDDRSDLRYDMNAAVPSNEHERYATLIDIGCLEHVFDTRVCLENCLRMITVGGHLLLHTPVNGYFGHGLHVFHPEAILSALELNGFDLRYVKYCLLDGTPVADPGGLQDAIIWAVARKTRSLETFVCPQQGRWSTRYLPTSGTP
jgi:hypothetical protein